MKISPHLGYMEAGLKDLIPSNAMLIYAIEVLDVKSTDALVLDLLRLAIQPTVECSAAGRYGSRSERFRITRHASSAS